MGVPAPYPVCTTLPGYTAHPHTPGVMTDEVAACRTRHLWAQVVPAAWVRCPGEVTLLRVVTVLREVVGFMTRARRAVLGNNWIDSGTLSLQELRDGIVAEEGGFLGFRVARGEKSRNITTFVTFAQLAPNTRVIALRITLCGRSYTRGKRSTRARSPPRGE